MFLLNSDATVTFAVNVDTVPTVGTGTNDSRGIYREVAIYNIEV